MISDADWERGIHDAYKHIITEAEKTIRGLVDGDPDAEAQARSWLTAYGKRVE